MKTYCKPKGVNIEDISLIERAVYKAFDGKFRRRDFQALLISSSAITKAELERELSSCSRARRLLSYKGWITATDSKKIETLYGTRQLLAAAAEIVGMEKRRTRCKRSTPSTLTA